MRRVLIFLFWTFFLASVNAQIAFDEQLVVDDPRLPSELRENILKLEVYNLQKPKIFKGVKNRIGLSCGGIKKNKLSLGPQEGLDEKDDYVKWKSSKQGRWMFEMSVDNDWKTEERWVDNDTLRWMRVYSFRPQHLDSVTLQCYYEIDDKTSIEVGQVKVAVHDIPHPVLAISDRSLFPAEIEKNHLLTIDLLESNMPEKCPEQHRFTKIVDFELLVRRKKKEKVFRYYGNRLSPEMRAAIRTSKKGTEIIFQNIKAERFQFPDLVFKIK